MKKTKAKSASPEKIGASRRTKSKTKNKVKTKASKNSNLTSVVEETINELLGMLKIEGNIIVNLEQGSQDEPIQSFRVNIETVESGLLIGYHGETINSLQLLLGVILYKKTGNWVRVILDVGGYRQMREDSIREMVERMVAEVERTGQEVELPMLTPLERRIVHVMLAKNEKVISESHGEGKDRRLSIKPRQN